MRILVVDDEIDICEILQYNLEAEGYIVEIATSAEEALQKDISSFNLLLLDVMMSGMSGFSLAKELRNRLDTANIPIIFITALDSEDDIVKGLNLGADDYIAKPLSIKEVKARVKAVLRRVASEDDLQRENLITYKDLVLDTLSKTASIDKENILFTRLEFEILSLLVQNQGRLFSREELLKKCWPKGTIVTDRTVDVNIARLRRKLGKYGKCIKARIGYGYTFKEE